MLPRLNLFKRKRKLHFAVVLSERPVDKFQFIPDKDCKVFIFSGEADPREGIPRSAMKTAMEKFNADLPQTNGETKITEVPAN